MTLTAKAAIAHGGRAARDARYRVKNRERIKAREALDRANLADVYIRKLLRSQFPELRKNPNLPVAIRKKRGHTGDTAKAYP